MSIVGLDHVNLRTTQLDEMIRWYTDVLGLKQGWRPHFPFPGAWLYAGDHAVVHLVDIDTDPATGAEVDLKLEHFALRATDLGAFEARLAKQGAKMEKSELADAGIVQVNVWDPDGNHIHVDFAI